MLYKCIGMGWEKMGVDTALKSANLFVKQAFYSPPVLRFSINPFQSVFIFRLIFFFLNNCLAFRHLPDQFYQETTRAIPSNQTVSSDRPPDQLFFPDSPPDQTGTFV